MSGHSLNKLERLGLAASLLAFLMPPASPAAETPAVPLREGLTAACDAPASSLEEMARRITGAVPLAHEPLEARGVAFGWRRRLGLPEGAELRIERIAPGGGLRRLTVEYHAATTDGTTRPLLSLVADPACKIRFGRRLLYEKDESSPSAVQQLDAELKPTGVREPLNPPVPKGTDPGGVPAALVDAGVNYLLPEIRDRLARGENGEILGYDYWDLDRRPFDANPARSPFFPQRHGTKTASLLLHEAPQARLVPYRYPRPDMARMTDLISDAAAHGIRIVNLSMGSEDPAKWAAFADAARRHSRMLFVVSAGNNGRNIDEQPVYPAALNLDNTITVTSSEDDGVPAYGSNWGSRSVDLLVPAERLRVTGFDGGAATASGSSYAAVRITALAARLLADHPAWTAEDLKSAIFERVLPNFSGRQSAVSQGFIPRPDKAERLPPLKERGPVRETGRRELGSAALYAGSETEPRRHGLTMTFAYFENTEWRIDDLRRHARQAAGILAQCGIVIEAVDVRGLDGPAVYRYFHDAIATELVDQTGLAKPTVYFVKDTLQVDPYDAEAIGRSNSAGRPALRDTVWIVEDTRDPAIVLAHELAHVLMDDGTHVESTGNLMRARTAPENTRLDDDQCRTMTRAGRENGLLNG